MFYYLFKHNNVQRRVSVSARKCGCVHRCC